MSPSDSPLPLKPAPLRQALRWLSSWRILRRGLIGLAGFITLVAAFYTVENWRGRRAWEQCKRELEAKGEKLDWDAFIPPPVPDEQNFFKAPGMAAWFSRKARDTNSNVQIFSIAPRGNGWPWSLEELRKLPERPSESRTNPVDLATVALPGVVDDVVPKFIFDGVQLRDAIDNLARQVDLSLTWDASSIPTNTVGYPVSLKVTNQTAREVLSSLLRRFNLEVRWDVTGRNLEIVARQKPTTAVVNRTELRESFARLEAEYQLLASACTRPKSRLADDYTEPFAMDIPSFVNARKVAQSLSVHASLSLLDGQPDAAVRDLAMMRRVGEVMDDSNTLVGTMINVAIQGLYLQTARDALEAGLWQEPQLAALQQQTRDVNLLANLAQSWRGAERAGAIRVLDRSPAELAKVFAAWQHFGGSNVRGGIDWFLLFNRIKFELCPRGWIQQNQASLARAGQELLDSFDTSSRRIHAARLNTMSERLQKLSSARSPYTFLATRATPNIIRAVPTLARNQTQLDQLHVACALERYRLAHGSYPEKLVALIPAFLDHVPKDLFADGPLQYRRDESSGYLLWSVGWDEKDEGGIQSFDKGGKPAYDASPGDWVWQHSH